MYETTVYLIHIYLFFFVVVVILCFFFSFYLVVVFFFWFVAASVMCLTFEILWISDGLVWDGGDDARIVFI